MPPTLNPITCSLILLSHNLLNLFAFSNFFENLFGIEDIILFFRNALTSLSEVISAKFFFHIFLSLIESWDQV